MEKVINNPGLQHLAENIFLNLNYADLKKCQLINQSASQILDNPIFWNKELIRKGLSKENQKDWIKAIQSVMNSEKKKHIAAYLKWNLKKKNLFNFPCYTKPAVQEDFRMKIQKIYMRLHKGSFSSSLLHFPSKGNEANKARVTPCVPCSCSVKLFQT